MGDNAFGERGRDTRRKKFFPNSKEREERNYGSRRLPVILTKPDGERDGKYYRNKPQENLGLNAEKPLSQPTIILQKSRDVDNRAVSPSQRSKKENETTTPLYTLAAKHTNSENTNALSLPVEMKSAVKLIDDQFQCLDACLEFLSDQTDFVVVGCIGMQGVGKSTLMSHLAGSCPSQLLNTIFKSQTVQDQKEWRHCTSGIDFYITPNRTVFLDCQPILSSSVIQDPKKIMSSTLNSVELMSTENTVEVQSLQLTAFLMSVCHVLLLVQDWFYNPNLVRFLQTAAMLKPVTNTAADDGQLLEYFPQVMFVHTQCLSSDFSAERVKLMQEVYRESFSKSLLQLYSGIGIANGGVIHALSPTSLDQEPLNLFLLPPLVDQDVKGSFQGHPGYEDLLLKMQQQLQGVGALPLSTTQLSEKNWLHYATKTWDNIKKSTFFQEYNRLLP